MIPRRNSLLRTLFKSILLPGAAAAILGVFIVYNLVKEEYDELLDISLNSKAHLLLNIFETSRSAGTIPDATFLSTLLAFEDAANEQEDWTVYWFLDGSGRVVAQSPGADIALLPLEITDGMSTAQDHRIAILNSDIGDEATVIVAVPMAERNEAITDVLIGMIVGFVFLGLLFAGAAFWAVRRSVGVIADLSGNIAEKGEHNLTPIDRQNSFAEIEPAIDTLDTLMARLDSALAAERAFATNAAHELRTPVAICLAHVQRLKTTLKDPATSGSAAQIELGLKRLVRLIERLLQMSRAQSGIGINAVETDLNQVTSLLLKELREREPSEDKLIIKYPTGDWPSHVDPDALGMMLNNLFENALRHASGSMPTIVDANQAGRVVVSNDCDALDAADLEAIKHRFIRKATMSDGYGLGLSIVQELCNQSGCTFEVASPQQGKLRGFTAILTFPQDNA